MYPFGSLNDAEFQIAAAKGINVMTAKGNPLAFLFASQQAVISKFSKYLKSISSEDSNEDTTDMFQFNCEYYVCNEFQGNNFDSNKSLYFTSKYSFY